MMAEEWGIAGIVLVLILFLSLRKKLLDPLGIISGCIVSIYTAYQGGLGSFLAIILFFLVGEFVTRAIRNRYHRKEHGQRSLVNIVGNIGPALIALTINPISFNVMFFASLSAAFADTLSSEIGVLSREKPLMITTLRPAQAGEDGAVSILGFAGAAVGALLFGILGYVLTGHLIWAAILFLAGMIGTIFDSLVGATLQKSGWTDNNTTNFFSAFAVGLFFALLF